MSFDSDERFIKLWFIIIGVLVAAILAGTCWGGYELIHYITSNGWKK